MAEEGGGREMRLVPELDRLPDSYSDLVPYAGSHHSTPIPWSHDSCETSKTVKKHENFCVLHSLN